MRLILCLFLFPTLLSAETIEEGTAAHPAFSVMLSGAQAFRAVDSSQDIRLSAPESPDAILRLKFDQEVPGMLRDAAGNYQISANYVFQKDCVAAGCAQFVKPENHVAITSPPELWPGVGDVQDFTIEFWIKPVIFYRRNSILKKVSLIGGEKRGLEIYLDSGKLHASFYNLFEDSEGRRHSIDLAARSGLTGQDWRHVTLTYHAASGRITLYLQDREEQTATAADPTGVFNMNFHPLDRSPIEIGGSYFGSIDEFVLSVGALSPEEGARTRLPAARISEISYRTEQDKGIVLSKIHDAGFSSGGRFRYAASEPAGTSIQFYVRFSTSPFAETTSAEELPWKRIAGFTDSIDRFRYFQWKAVLVADPTGMVSPILKETKLSFFPILPPARPGGLRILDDLSSDDMICLEWRKNPEPEIETANGTYVIYYGLKPGEYTGRITIKDGKPIHQNSSSMPLTEQERNRLKFQEASMRRTLSTRVRFLLTNRVIEENIYKHARKKNMPFLRPDQAYYFAVAALTPDGESVQSREAVFVLRPKPDL
ncbi:MAG: LamG domain-containing protein [Spirochaetia bacterium]|nr:LamG domain-containing protein [Spirochaetia bacterium]